MYIFRISWIFTQYIVRVIVCKLTLLLNHIDFIHNCDIFFTWIIVLQYLTHTVYNLLTFQPTITYHCCGGPYFVVSRAWSMTSGHADRPKRPLTELTISDKRWREMRRHRNNPLVNSIASQLSRVDKTARRLRVYTYRLHADSADKGQTNRNISMTRYFLILVSFSKFFMLKYKFLSLELPHYIIIIFIIIYFVIQ